MPMARDGDDVAALADPLHAEVEALAGLAEDVALGHADVVEDQRGRAALAHGLDRAPSVQPIVAVDQEAVAPPSRAPVPVGHREHDGEVGLVAAGDEGLLAVDDPVVAVAAGAEPMLRRVGARRPAR